MLKQALINIHSDREWWQKILAGGAIWLTIVGYPVVEGYQIESIDNSRNGFPTPLPRWDDIGGKAVQGLFALVVDFLFFLFPIFASGLCFLFVGLALVITGASADLVRTLTIVGAALLFGWLSIAWLCSVSPIAKQMCVSEGLPQQALSSTVFRRALEAPARRLYLKARLSSAPPYLLSIGLFILALLSMDWSGWLTPVLLWLAFAALLYARMVTVQVYDIATREAERLRFEARRARMRT